jgi:DNA-binding MarR family transcriptional regulator
MVNDVIADPLAVANQLRPVLLRLARELRHETESLGITSRQVTLLWLIRGNPGLSLRELAAEERISAPALSGHVDRLVKVGLVERVRDEDDRRRVGLALTEAGNRALKRVRARRTSWLAERLRGLEPAEIAAVEAAIEPLSRLLEGKQE